MQKERIITGFNEEPVTTKPSRRLRCRQGSLYFFHLPQRIFCAAFLIRTMNRPSQTNTRLSYSHQETSWCPLFLSGAGPLRRAIRRIKTPAMHPVKGSSVLPLLRITFPATAFSSTRVRSPRRSLPASKRHSHHFPQGSPGRTFL